MECTDGGIVDSSNSSSDLDCYVDDDRGQGVEELTLQDDENSVLLVQPPEAVECGEEGDGPGLCFIHEEDKNFIFSKKKKRRKKFLYICLTNCKYDIVQRTAARFGFREVSEDDDWSLFWTDFSVALERAMEMKKYQKINHFPGMNEICRKDLLARNLNRMVKLFPKEYSFFPKTWCLPADYGDFHAYTRQKKNKAYILKPESGCQGRGIWLTKSSKDIKPQEHMICQVYANKPYLIDGFKFDLRIYTLVTSCNPLRIFVFKDGLARFATNKYSEPTVSNSENVCMHLTNYAINKNSEDFVRDGEVGSKRRISTINRHLQSKGVDIEKMWSDIDDIIIKTLISAQSVLKHNYRTCFPNHVRTSACFEILGFDVLLDRNLHPHIIEVNHSPSFCTDSALDRDVKGTLIWDTLNLINVGALDRRRCADEEKRRIKDRLLGKGGRKETKEEQDEAQLQYLNQLERYENSHMGNFRRIFPKPGCDKYDKYFYSCGSLFQETATFRARSELARQQREQIVAREKGKFCSKNRTMKSTDGGVAPESPSGQWNPPNCHRPAVSFHRRLSRDVYRREHVIGGHVADTCKPDDILQEEELERVNGLLQRDRLVRGLGIVEHVQNILSNSPGNTCTYRHDRKVQSVSADSIWRIIKSPSSDTADRSSYHSSMRHPSVCGINQQKTFLPQRPKLTYRPVACKKVKPELDIVIPASQMYSTTKNSFEEQDGGFLANSGANQPFRCHPIVSHHTVLPTTNHCVQFSPDKSAPTHARIFSADPLASITEKRGFSRFLIQPTYHGLSVVTTSAPVAIHPCMMSASNFTWIHQSPPVHIQPHSKLATFHLSSNKKPKD